MYRTSFPECDENIHCEDHENTEKSTCTQIMPEDQDVSNDHQGDTTLEVILKDQQQDFEMAETINSEECEDMDPVLGASQDNGLPSKITMDNTNIQETVNSENECFVEPPQKKRKIQLHSTDRESQSKTAKVLEIVLGKTAEVSDIDWLKQTVSKSSKAHFYRKKYDSVLSKVQTQVLRELRFVKEELRKWDEDFFTKNDRLPNKSDYMGDDDIKELS